MDEKARTVTWFLPASKTDPRGLGKTRSWGCVCNVGEREPCPYHSMVKHHKDSLLHFGRKATTASPVELPVGLTVFPTLNGGVVAKEAMVSTINEIAKRCGHDITNIDGTKKFTGHFYRVLGARHMASKGIQITVIQLMARWQSDVVLRYVRDAPLETITQEYRTGCVEQNLQKLIENFNAQSRESLDSILKLSIPNFEDIKEELVCLTQRVVEVEQAGYVCNGPIDTGKVHKPMLEGLSVNASLWKCKCGFKHGLANGVVRCKELPDDWRRICSMCLPVETTNRKSLSTEERVEDNSSSESSSENSDEE